MLWGFCFCFLQGFIFDFFSLLAISCTAGICAEPYSGKNNDMGKDFKTKYFFSFL